MTETHLAVFKGKQIRKATHNNEWWFSISDVVEALTDSADAKQYVKKMRQRDPELDSYWGTICTPLEIMIAFYRAYPALGPVLPRAVAKISGDGFPVNCATARDTNPPGAQHIESGTQQIQTDEAYRHTGENRCPLVFLST